MAQKDKVKELVGRGLDSYHTKSLQQIDRIERKNKEQNHKISILTNELDNDYLTKTEEGSVVSLEHSKEGMIYLDELQGNTLVNYCVDGAKELTLNGDIDVEGTSVTLTEGVDNGLVDIMCEGNTLVSLKCSSNQSHGKHIIDFTSNLFKENTTYTFIFDLNWTYNATDREDKAWFGFIVGSHPNIGWETSNTYITRGRIVTTATPKSSKTFRIGTYLDNVITVENLMVFEGDLTQTPGLIPTEYFEGMKSVGECEDNKIEILSHNGNYVNTENTEQIFPYTSNGVTFSKNNLTYRVQGSTSAYPFVRAIEVGRLEPNTTYKFTCKSEGVGEYSLRLISRKDKDNLIMFQQGTTFTTPSDIRDDWGIDIATSPSETIDRTYSEIMIVKVDNIMSYKPHSLNKKEITLSEPLRALPNGVKDKIVKIGGKHYVERSCGQMLLTGSESWNLVGNFNTHLTVCTTDPLTNAKLDRRLVISDTMPSVFDTHDANINYAYNGYISPSGKLNVLVSTDICSKLSSVSVEGWRNYLATNYINVVYELETPTYEEIIDPALTTYNDITHISNNSTIPCNMTVKNTGYNAIIKPSTQYTVAFDSNKSGEVGINLAGSKVTTTNNVATVTTPSTLTDDSLRLTGKGIKASKVRLLEGDKTNWIPSHFEGMKSCFEDKLQEDGTYKMEILSNNKNLFRYDSIVKRTSQSEVEYGENYVTITDAYYCGNIVKIKPFTNYYISVDATKYDENSNSMVGVYVSDGENVGASVKIASFFSSKGVFNSGNNNYVSILLYGGSGKVGKVKYSNVLLTEFTSETEHTPQKSNKIQFSSIEPLRGVGDIKDRFVFKDGKLMIERNCGVKAFDGDESWAVWNNDIRPKSFLLQGVMPSSETNISLVCDILPSVNYGGTWSGTAFGIGSQYSNIGVRLDDNTISTVDTFKEWLSENPITILYQLAQPYYEETPYELQKIILEGYEDGTLFLDTNIPPTVTTTYAGETPIVKATRLNKTEVLNNTNDINDNIVPYLMDMDYRVVCLQLEGGIENVSMARLFGGTYEMLQRDILSNRYSKEEYKYRLDTYLSANKITEDEYNKLGDMLNE